MSIITSRPPITPDDLLRMPDEVQFELVDGNLVERQMGAESSEIACRIIFLIGLFLEQHRIGRLLGSDTGYRCFRNAPDKVRRCDVGFVRLDRLPAGRAPKGYVLVVPDLVVEVVSPNDTADEVEEKVAEWIGAGAPLVWVAYPSTRSVRVHRPASATAGRVSDLIGEDTLGGDDVLPGFSCRVNEIFENQ